LESSLKKITDSFYTMPYYGSVEENAANLSISKFCHCRWSKHYHENKNTASKCKDLGCPHPADSFSITIVIQNIISILTCEDSEDPNCLGERFHSAVCEKLLLDRR